MTQDEVEEVVADVIASYVADKQPDGIAGWAVYDKIKEHVVQLFAEERIQLTTRSESE